MISIDIAVCTFRREHVSTTLASLEAQIRPADWQICIVVADNDETPSAKARIEAAAASMSIPVHYLHAPARNISTARNACLEAATAPLLAFFDDDQIASPHWLSELIKTYQETGAQVVLGPVIADYPSSAPDWLKKGDFHSTTPAFNGSELTTGYAGNVLFARTHPAFSGLRFDLALGRTGGEDTAFFHAAHKAGAKIAYAPEARATEQVPPERMTLSWLARRRFRAGQTHGALLKQKQGCQAGELLKAAAKAAFCFATILTALDIPERWRFWYLRGIMHLGVCSRLLGKKELVQYG